MLSNIRGLVDRLELTYTPYKWGVMSNQSGQGSASYFCCSA